MPPRKRTPAERELSLIRIAELFVQRRSQSEIARELGLSRSQIQRDLQLIRSRWQQAQVTEFNAAVQEELVRLAHLERVAWDAWERSRQVAERRTKSRRETSSGPQTKVSIVEEEQVGNPRFLDRIAWCVQMRSRILGLEAPIKTANLHILEMSEQELVEQEQRLGLERPVFQLPHR